MQPQYLKLPCNHADLSLHKFICVCHFIPLTVNPLSFFLLEFETIFYTPQLYFYVHISYIVAHSSQKTADISYGSSPKELERS